MFTLSSCVPDSSVSFYMVLFVLQLELLDTSIICKSNFLLSCHSLISVHVLLSMLNNLMSGIPSSAGPFPGTLKNLHLAHLFLCLNFTVHMPNCSIFYWLYVFNMAELLVVACNSAIFVVFGNRILNVLHNIKLPWFLVYILYFI